MIAGAAWPGPLPARIDAAQVSPHILIVYIVS
jgi:hypothetical protein